MAYAVALGIVAYIATAAAIVAWMGALHLHEQVRELRARLEARAALCRDRRCQLEFEGDPIDFTFFRRRPAVSGVGPQETSTPG